MTAQRSFCIINSMKPLSRRQFVQLASLGLGAVALDPLLAACANSPATISPADRAASTPTEASQPTALPKPVSSPSARPATAVEAQEPLQVDPTSLPAGAPHLVVARGSDPEEMVRQALTALGGMEKFVPKGARVVIKPNICVAYHTYEYAATTNPWVVGALVRLALQAGAVKRPGNGLPLRRQRQRSLCAQRDPGAGAGCWG